MKILTIIFGLCLLGGSTQRGLLATSMNQKDVQDFCEVMATPKRFKGKVITLQASAHIIHPGVLLKSSQCKASEVTVHFMAEYEKESNAMALEAFEQFRRKAQEAYLRGVNAKADAKAERIVLSVVFEGRLEKNPYYHVMIPRGEATLAAWDYSYEYAFVVTRIISVRSPE